MKKLTIAFILLSMMFSIILFSGCGPNTPTPSSSPVVSGGPSAVPSASSSPSPSTTPTPEEQPDAKDYYPIYENVRLVYEGQGNEFAYFNEYIDFTADNKMQIRIDNGGSQIVKVIEVRDDAIVETMARGEIYYRENMMDKKGEEEILLQEPFKVGTSWTLADSSVRSITSVDASVTTPSGTYQAIEVTTEGEYGKTMDYYARGIGLVKSVFESEGGEVSSSLSKIEQDAPYVQNVNFYYPSVEDESLFYYVSKEISFRTNDITKQMLRDAYKSNVEVGTGKVLSQNTEINSLYLNDDGMVYIDLSKDYLTEMNAGSGFEAAMMQCVANTFGQYYNVDKVILTIDNENYSSGHIELEKGEFLTVNFDKTKSITE